MKLPIHDLLGLLIATSFAAGLNVYATVATLGVLARTGAIGLPPSLQLLASWYVIAAAVALFAVEFFADKIPAFDLIWNALHTFIRVPVGGGRRGPGRSHNSDRDDALDCTGAAGPVHKRRAPYQRAEAIRTFTLAQSKFH